MRKSWQLLPKILSGKKKIESRWYMNKSAPWGKIKKGEKIYFKNSGELITVSTRVKKVLSFENLTPKKVKDILNEYSEDDGIEKKDEAPLANASDIFSARFVGAKSACRRHSLWRRTAEAKNSSHSSASLRSQFSAKADKKYFYERFKNKKYCLLIFLETPKKIKPFEVDKKGFGLMAAWICVNSIEQIKKAC
jgi:ASC-1-like (ASCH) protein